MSPVPPITTIFMLERSFASPRLVRLRSSERSGSAQVLPLGQLAVADQGEQGLAWRAQLGDDEADPGVRAVVAILVVDDVAAGLPERLAGSHDSLRLTLHLEAQLAVQDVAERGPGMPVRGRPRVARR